jgi:glutathione S-transferase
MSEIYRIYGAEVSPYSVKVRSYCRYKQIPHEWIQRDQSRMEEFQRYAKLPLIPLVVMPDDSSMQDSTPIIEALEARFPEPTIQSPDPVVAFLSALMEEFADEWGNKWMFHYRWAREVDQVSAATRIAKSMMPDLDDEKIAGIAEGIRQRMVSRVGFVGSSEQTAPQIEDSFQEGIGQLEAHLATRPYLFGARPALGDFGLWGQVYNAWTDTTAGALIESNTQHVVAWVKRMLEPKAEGGFEAWDTLSSTLTPFMSRQIGRLFLPWSDANAKALAAGEDEFTIDLDGHAWTQKPQKYHARSLTALRKRYADVGDNAALDAILDSTGCLRWLK